MKKTKVAYPLFKEDLGGKVQIKIVSFYECAIVAIIKGKDGYDRWFDQRRSMDEWTANRYLALPDSTENKYMDQLKAYCEEIAKVKELLNL